jgi:hypothetical protein
MKTGQKYVRFFNVSGIGIPVLEWSLLAIFCRMLSDAIWEWPPMIAVPLPL